MSWVRISRSRARGISASFTKLHPHPDHAPCECPIYMRWPCSVPRRSRFVPGPGSPTWPAQLSERCGCACQHSHHGAESKLSSLQSAQWSKKARARHVASCLRRCGSRTSISSAKRSTAVLVTSQHQYSFVASLRIVLFMLLSEQGLVKASLLENRLWHECRSGLTLQRRQVR